MRAFWLAVGAVVLGVGAIAYATGATTWTWVGFVAVGLVLLGVGLVRPAKPTEESDWEYREARSVGEHQRPGAVSPRPGKKG